MRSGGWQVLAGTVWITKDTKRRERHEDVGLITMLRYGAL